MTNEHLHELTAAYALDALDADDRLAFEAHLDGCERCRADLAELGETVGALALAAEGPAPPESLRDRILVAAREEPPQVVALRPRRTRFYVAGAVAAAASAALAIGLWAGLSGNGPTRVALRGANGTLVVHSSGHAEMSVSNLAAAPAGKAYEVWVLDGRGGVLPAGQFKGGPGTSVVSLAVSVERGSLVAVTLEHAGKVSRPTSKVLFTARLAA